MDLRRIEDIPIFTSTVDAYALSQFKTEEGKLVAQMHSKLESGVRWNTERIVDSTNALVDVRDAMTALQKDIAPFVVMMKNRKDSMSTTKAVLLASFSGGVATFIGEGLIHWMNVR